MKTGKELNLPAFEVARFSGLGTVESWTVVYDAPEGFTKYAPYAVAWIRLDEGPLVTAMMTDVDNKDVRIGMRVESVVRVLYELNDNGLIIYGYKFRPILSES